MMCSVAAFSLTRSFIYVLDVLNFFLVFQVNSFLKQIIEFQSNKIKGTMMYKKLTVYYQLH